MARALCDPPPPRPDGKQQKGVHPVAALYCDTAASVSTHSRECKFGLIAVLCAGRTAKTQKGSVPAPPPANTAAQPISPETATHSTEPVRGLPSFAFDTASPDDAVTAAQQQRTHAGAEARPPPTISKARGNQSTGNPVVTSGTAARHDAELRGAMAVLVCRQIVPSPLHLSSVTWNALSVVCSLDCPRQQFREHVDTSFCTTLGSLPLPVSLPTLAVSFNAVARQMGSPLFA